MILFFVKERERERERELMQTVLEKIKIRGLKWSSNVNETEKTSPKAI